SCRPIWPRSTSKRCGHGCSIRPFPDLSIARAAATVARDSMNETGLRGERHGRQSARVGCWAWQHGEIPCERLSSQPGLRDRGPYEPDDKVEADFRRAEGISSV